MTEMTAQLTDDRICRVTFLPMNKTVEARMGTALLDVAIDHEIELEHNCGGNCACSTCHVIVRDGADRLSPKSEDEEDQLEDADGPTPDSRLACQAKLLGDVTVEIPVDC